eukprot:TRINITY_DN4339_c0_g5_i1.p1 TRINITY_DN4339_c0_g5~~TRINITY_DN4339_c0_g5_i1.p1  ORF type:complete len:882 (-),score=309.93 TRINITY_DN4339_c0_g5_i1:381-3026(-)
MAVAKAAVVGIDIGAGESYVAYVGKGVVDIVQNEVSKRNTGSLVGFTDRERLLGDAALAQIRSNAKNSCRNFKHLLGRKVDAPDVEKEHFWSTAQLCTADDGFCGYAVNFKGEAKNMSATTVTSMYLTKLREITENWCQAKVTDVVLAAPSAFSDIQRQALLDAAKIAGLHVLRIMNEHTATALAYGIYRSNDFDPEKPMTVAFCSVGHSIFSVSIVKFVRGKLQVVCEKSDKCGGREMDECLMREFAAQFKKKHGCDPLSTKKSMYKLEDAVTKTKKILSANYEAPVNVECLMEDEDFSSQMTRELFEKMCEPMMGRVKAVLTGAIEASGMKPEEIDSVEIIGGSSRVPWVKKMISEAFGGKELSTTMNQEEAVARGCALQAAILSPLYKVRDFEVKDTTNFGIKVGWYGSAADSQVEKEDDGDATMGGAEGEYKTAEVFPIGSQTNTLKLMTFYRTGPFDIKAEFTDDSPLLPGTAKELGTYRVELPPQTEAKKVKVKAQLTLHGTFQIQSAQMVEEEVYEETVKEKRELPPSPEASPETNGDKDEAEKKEEEKKPEADADVEMKDGEAENKEEAEAGAEEKEEEKPADKKPEKREPKYEWVDVIKKKKRTKRTDLKITKTGTPGLSDAVLQQAMDYETALQAEMREIIETDEKRNDLEGYIFTSRDKASESGEWGPFISAEAREKFMSELTAAEDWLYDTVDATKAQYIEKMDELRSTGDAVQWRFKESTARDEWISAVLGTIKNYRNAAEEPGPKYGHIAQEKLEMIIMQCNDLEKWIEDMKAKQAAMPKHEKPILICADMDKKNQELAKMADAILKEPKPAPPKEKKEKEEPEAPTASPDGEKETESPAKGDEAESSPKADENPDLAKEGDEMEVD